MSHQSGGGAGDDELRARLRAADPAATLPPADPTRTARLLEDTMTDQLTDESRTDGTRDRSPLTWLIGAAAALLIAGGVVFAVTQGGDDDPAPTAGDRPVSSAGVDPERTTTELSVDAGAAASGRCMTPAEAPQVVAAQTTVVDATVESISGSNVTLAPTRFYAGDPTDVVVVQAPSSDMRALLAAVTFEEGGRYLVAATDGRVTLCGFTDVYSDELAAVYARAFPG